MTESNRHIEKYPNEVLQASYFGRICEDSNASPHIIAYQDSEKRNKRSHSDCSDGFKHCQSPCSANMIEVDNRVQPYGSKLEKYACVTAGSSQDVGKSTDQEACAVPENRLHCVENLCKASSQVTTTFSYSVPFAHFSTRVS